MRIVSLLPSATEIVCALGAAAELVGRSHECDFPESIVDRPVLTSARIAAGASSREIDAAVREVGDRPAPPFGGADGRARGPNVDRALSIYAVDDARLAALAPDVIVTQDLCEVCAVSLDDVRAAVARLAHREQLAIVSLSPTRLGDVMADVERVAAAIGRADRGRAVRAELEARIGAIAARAAGVAVRPRVVTLEWIDPLMIGGTWMPELVELAGGIAVGATAGAPAPTITPETLRQLAPDVVVIKPCGFTLARTLEELDLIGRSVVTVVPTARLYITDGNAFFNRPGPRLVESLEIMAACVDPERFADFATLHREVIHVL